MTEVSTPLPCDEARAARLAAFDWTTIRALLDAHGHAVLPGLLEPDSCHALAALYPQREQFRSRVVMARHGFGSGEYQYFDYPLPSPIRLLRTSIYPQLVPLANQWNEVLDMPLRYPEHHADFLARCHAAGQILPTPLLLQYRRGDYNCLHQDLYGEQVFPIQLAILLSAPGRDFSGGELVLTEQRPRMQSRVEVVPMGQGDGVLFAVHRRPVRGSRGYYQVNMRHGVSRLRSGLRHTLGIIFHDAA